MKRKLLMIAAASTLLALSSPASAGVQWAWFWTLGPIGCCKG